MIVYLILLLIYTFIIIFPSINIDYFQNAHRRVTEYCVIICYYPWRYNIMVICVVFDQITINMHNCCKHYSSVPNPHNISYGPTP